MRCGLLSNYFGQSCYLLLILLCRLLSKLYTTNNWSLRRLTCLHCILADGLCGQCSVILVCTMFHSEAQNHVTSATKRPSVVLRNDNDDDDDRFTCPPTLSDAEPPEMVRRRAPPELEKSVDDDAKSPIGPGYQLMTSSRGTAAPPPWSVYRSATAAARILAPAASAAAFHLAAFHSLYASQQQQQQQQLRHSHQLPPPAAHLRFSHFTDEPSAPGRY